MQIDLVDFTRLVPANSPIKRYTLWGKARNFYCRRVTATGRCAQDRGSTCAPCHQYLREAMDLPRGNRPMIGLYIWRLRNAAAAAMEELTPPPPKRRKEWEVETRNPFEIFLEELGESAPPQS